MFVDRFESLLRTGPDRPVAIATRGTLDRAELQRQALVLAAALRAAPTGARIALRTRCAFRFLAGLLAIWRHRGTAVLLDPAEPPAAQTAAAATLRAAALLDADRAECRPASGPAAPAEDFAALKLTSGSTGAPRGVLATFAQLAADAEALETAMALRPDDRVLAAVPPSFSYGLGSVAVPALLFGRAIVLPDEHEPLALLAAARRGEPTVLPTVPAFLRALLDSRRPLPASVRLVVSAGARLDPALARSFRQAHGRAVHAFYGASECGGICFDRTGTAAERGTVGTPVDGVDVAVGDDGRVRVRSAAVAARTEPDCGSIRGGEFTAGDLAEFVRSGPFAGELALVGRANDVIDVGGYKVQPREVEQVIAELPGVRDVAVVAWQPPSGRAGCAALVAGAIDEAAIRRHCVERLAPPKVPRCIAVVAELPRNSRGKLERTAAQRVLDALDGCAANERTADQDCR